MNLKLNKRALTLVEVLITLGIIGVLAAMTIPNLLNKTNDAELKTAWKKAYSVFSQATLQMANDNGGTLKGLFTSNGSIVEEYSKYIKKSKVCESGINEKCRAPVIQLLNQDGNNYLADNPGLILADGMYFQPWLNSGDCSTPVGSPVIFYRCAGAAIDVNGYKKPNVFGIDVFEIHILENRVLPYGVDGDNHSSSDETDCTKNATATGESCSAKYLYSD